MEVLLVSPIGHHAGNITMPPIGLGYLDRSLKRNAKSKYESKIIDCDMLGLDLDNFSSFIDENDFNVYAMSCWSHTYINVIKMIKVIKNKKANSTVVLGGPHPSCSAINTIKDNSEIDFIFTGEAEKGFPMLIDLLANNSKGYIDYEKCKKIPGLGFRCNDKIVINPPFFEENLDELDFLDWHVLNLESYIKKGYRVMFTKNFPSAPLIGTRGCPYPCTYCAASRINGRRIRRRSIDNIIREIIYLYDKFSIREIQFMDDNLTYDREFILSLCEEIKKIDKSDLAFSSPNGLRIERLDEEVIENMREAGWYIMHLGIETGNKTTQNLMKKDISLELIRDKVNLIKECELFTFGFFMIGFPNEDIQDALRTLFYAVSLKLDFASFHPFTPFLGTEIYRYLVEKGEITSNRFSSFSKGVALFYSPPKMNVGILNFLSFLSFFIFHISSFRRLKVVMQIVDKKVLLRKVLKLITNYLFKGKSHLNLRY